MRDPNRIDVFLKKLGEYWKRVPDWRFGQLIKNLERFDYADWFFYEEEDFLKLLEDYFDNRPSQI